MKLIHTLLVSLILAAGAAAGAAEPPPSPPATPDPNAILEPAGLVRDLYTRYYAELTAQDAKPDTPRSPEMEWDAIADKYFTPELATRFKKAANAEEPVFDWDFFISGQDYDKLAVLSVDATTVDAASKVKIVTSNMDQKSTTLVELVKQPDGWRISDFVFSDGTPDAMRMTDFLKESGY